LLKCVQNESKMCKKTHGRMEMDEGAGCGSTTGNGGSGSKSQYLAGSRRLCVGRVCSGPGPMGAFNVACINASVGGSGKVCSGLRSMGTLYVDCIDASAEGSGMRCAEARGSWRLAGGDVVEIPWKVVTLEPCRTLVGQCPRIQVSCTPPTK
jgi:hypothetical protein